MTNARALLTVILVVAATTLVLVVMSRAPVALRTYTPGPRATDPSLGAHFTGREIRRGAAYQVPGYIAFALAGIVQIATLVVLTRGPLGRLADRLASLPGGWPLRTVLLAAFVLLCLTAAGLPLGFVTGFALGHAWGLSTQDFAGWLNDQARGLLVTFVTGGVAAVAFYGTVRAAPRTWWVWGWLTFSVLTFILVYLYPIVVTPLFNKFTPLKDPGLTRRIEALANDAGVPVKKVLVADASRRTIAENAYVAGFGSSRVVVVYDTLLKTTAPRETAFIVAHELGHAKENHVLKGTLLGCVGLLAGFGALALLARWDALWRLSGASGIVDPKGLALVLLFVVVAGLVTLPVQNAVSRNFESQADRIGVALTHDPEAAVREFRSLAFTNIADLAPPRAIVATLYTHPSIPDRIRAVQEGAATP